MIPHLMTRKKMNKYIVTDLELYLCEVGDGDPDLQYTAQEEKAMHQKCLGRFNAKDEADLRDQIYERVGYHAESLTYKTIQ